MCVWLCSLAWCVCAVESTSESNSHLCPTAAMVEIGPLIYSGRAVGMREREHIVFFIHHTTAAGCQRAQPYQLYGSSAFWCCVGEFWTSSSRNISINVISIRCWLLFAIKVPSSGNCERANPTGERTHSLTFNEVFQCTSYLLDY